MSIFKDSSSKKHIPGTTDGFFFGAPEAEAEKKYEKKNNVSFFDDYFEVIDEISSNKFIISGRKGTGKSAVVKYILDNKREDETYADVVLPKDYVLYKSVIETEDGVSITATMIWEWIVLTRFVKMILDTKANRYYKEYKPLELFWKNNSGFLEIEKFDIKEIIKSKKNQLSIGPLKKIFSAQYSDLIDYRLIHAPFYKLIPALKDIVKRILSMDIFKDIEYILMFDDLDIDFNINNENDKMVLMELIRLAKEYNTSIFLQTKGKILIFIRDDVSHKMQTVATDTSKVFGSYEYPLKWYTHEIGDDDYKNNRIMQFVNRRLQINFDALNIAYDKDNPWNSFIEHNWDVYEKPPFRYFLDFTFYRPRDFINMFKDLGSKKYQLPLSPANAKTILREYTRTNYTEISNELKIMFSESEVNNIKCVLKCIAEEAPVSFNRVLELLRINHLENSVINSLVEYNLLIPQDENRNQFFSYREMAIDESLENYKYALPKSVYAYYKPWTILPRVS